MKVLGICASNRKKGNSSIVLNELLRPIRDAGLEIELLHLGELKILPCRGCFGCSGTYHCILNDDLELVKEKIDAADAIALASPCYYLSTPSPIKAIMDRLASWAINRTASGAHKKYGVAVSVAGGAPIEFSLQRTYTSLFLGLFNCEITGQLTIGHTFTKGEILLAPRKLQAVAQLGENLLHSLEAGRCIKSPQTACEDKITCPSCLADVFQIHEDGRMVCPVCGEELKRTEKEAEQVFNRFTMAGALEHRAHIIDNVIGGMLASDEINRRLKAYWETDVLPQNDYPIDRDLTGVTDLADWDNAAEETLKAAIPDELRGVIRKVMTKRLLQDGERHMTKELARRYLPKF